jgi:hypothetical protein
VQLSITLRDCALDWYMSLDVNSAQGAPKPVVEVKNILLNEFYKLILEDQHMNEVIEIGEKPCEYV